MQGFCTILPVYLAHFSRSHDRITRPCNLFALFQQALITILKGRTQEEIEPILNSWGSEVLEQIEEVSIDLWNGYKTLVKKLMPNVQVVADRFHVMVQVNKELDTERKRERRQIIEASKKTKSLKKRQRKRKIRWNK
jgi:transposase